MTEELTELTPEMTGMYLITTQGSTHVWDLDNRRSCRLPTQSSQAQGFPSDYDAHWVDWDSVQRWPKVGLTFLIWLRGASLDWHQSSRIRSIKKFEKTEGPS